MNRLILSFLLLIIVKANCYGQYGNDTWLSDFEKTTFDPLTIKKNKITKVYIIATSGKRDVDGFAEKRDTLDIYYFDTLGKQITASTKGDSSIIKYTITKTDSTVTKYIMKNYGKGFDTALISKETYTKNKRVMEMEQTPTKFQIKSLSCNVGDNYHYKLRYDELGRVIYYRNFKYGYYHRIKYTEYGRKIETYDFKSDKLLHTENVLISKVHDVLNDTWTITETNRTRQVSKSYTNDLLKMEAVVEINYLPTINYIEYEYR